MSFPAEGEAPFVNAHTHLEGAALPESSSGMQILSLPSFTPGEVIPEWIRYFSAGYHPAQADSFSEEALYALLEDPRCLAVGECGLDPFAPAAMKLQQEVLLRQMILAQKTGKSMVIHCVRRFPEILSLRKKVFRDPSGEVPFLIHGFRAKAPIGEMLVQANCILSLSPVWLRHQEVFPEWLKKGGFLLETDMEDSGALPELYQQCAVLCNETLPEFKKQLYLTFCRFAQILNPSSL